MSTTFGSLSARHPLRLAVIDMYDGHANQGMRCLLGLLRDFCERDLGGAGEVAVFDCRGKAELPDHSWDVVISSGGPGSPFAGEGAPWEAGYLRFFEALWSHNQGAAASPRFLLSICYSFEILCRALDLAAVTKRRSPSFGIMPIHKTAAGAADPIYAGLPEPFYAADFREWQVVQPNHRRLAGLGATILSLEKIRPHVPLERAVTAMRVSPEVVGVQFHPEAEPAAMLAYFEAGERREQITRDHGEEKYRDILARVSDPGALGFTYRTVVPGFLRQAVAAIRPRLARAAAR